MPAPPEDETVPKWVDPGIQNKRHLVKPTGAHFLVPVQVGTGVIDAVLDTGGARSVIDVGTARELGLKVDFDDNCIHYQHLEIPMEPSNPRKAEELNFVTNTKSYYTTLLRL